MILRMQEAGGTLEMNISGLLKLLLSQSSLTPDNTEQRNRKGLCMKWGEEGESHGCPDVTKEP